MSTIEPTDAVRDSTYTARSDARDAIMAANARFVEAFRAGDADAVAACYTADAQLLPANSDVVTGVEAIASFWRGAMSLGIADARLQTVEVEKHGDVTVEVGRYSLSGADGGTIDEGKYVVLWRRDGGSWKLHRDIWTTSRPATTT